MKLFLSILAQLTAFTILGSSLFLVRFRFFVPHCFGAMCHRRFPHAIRPLATIFWWFLLFHIATPRFTVVAMARCPVNSTKLALATAEILSIASFFDQPAIKKPFQLGRKRKSSTKRQMLLRAELVVASAFWSSWVSLYVAKMFR